MPVPDMIGVNACQRSFCIASAFLSGQLEEDHIWALDLLRSIYESCSATLPSVIEPWSTTGEKRANGPLG